MKYFIPTYEQALKIVDTKGELLFYETKHKIDNYTISVFNYRLAHYDEFFNPIEGIENAKEMRGLAFVFNEDGSLYKRYIMLEKFWNVNQVEETQFNLLKDLKIKNVYTKEDGSLISFIELPNGKIIPKTKMGFDNDQVISVQKIYDNDENIQKFVKYCIKNNISCMWEYVSWQNKVVLNYNESKLILLRLRNNNTGEYLDVENYRDRGINIVESHVVKNLTELMELAKTLEDIEGWVIQFENDYLVKQKTAWYFDKHKLVSNLDYENIIIKMIIDDEIDDVLSTLNPENFDRIEWINNIEKIVRDYINEKVEEVNNLYSNFNGDIKDFAIRYKKDKNFGLAMNLVRFKTNSYDNVKEWLKEQTKHLMQARSFIDNKGFKRK